MLLAQTSLSYIIGPWLLLLGMVAVAGAVRQRTTHRIRSIEEEATKNDDSNQTAAQVVQQQEEEDISWPLLLMQRRESRNQGPK